MYSAGWHAVCLSIDVKRRDGVIDALSVVYRGSPSHRRSFVHVGYRRWSPDATTSAPKGSVACTITVYELFIRVESSWSSVRLSDQLTGRPVDVERRRVPIIRSFQRVSQYIGVTGRNGSTDIRARGRVFRHFPCLIGRCSVPTGVLIGERRRNV